MNATNNWISPSTPPTDAQLFRHDARFLIALSGLVTEAYYSRHSSVWLSAGDRSFLKIDAWRELPDPPPKPDAFEEWVKANPPIDCNPMTCCCIYVDGRRWEIRIDFARAIWDAAIASKGQP